MLRAILSSHLASADLPFLSAQMNGKRLGQREDAANMNQVISGNREVHMAASFYRSPQTREDRRFLDEEMRYFDRIFAEVQSQGIAALPALLHHFPLQPSALLLASASQVLAWHDRSRGLYLLRRQRLYRLQPARLPESLGEFPWMDTLDFYAFVPEDEDLLLLITADFMDHFRPAQLESALSGSEQIFARMQGLFDLGKTYGFQLEQSWFALQLKRLEENRFYGEGEGNGDVLSLDRVQRARHFSEEMDYSRVSRLMHGQRLIPAPPRRTSRRRPGRNTAEAPRRRPALALGISQDGQAAEARRLENRRARAERERNLAAYEAQRKPLDRIFERAREWTFAPLLSRWRHLLRRFFQIWPEQPLLSLFFAGCSCLLILLLFLLLMKGLLLRNRRLDQPSATRDIQSTQAAETIDPSARALVPAETNLEIAIVVRANTLELRQAMDASSALIATVLRGETVYQLAPAENGWVYVRTAGGVEGYVFADYLLQNP